MPAVRLTRKEKQERTRAAILGAAATLFADQGLEGTSMEAIARQAGLTQGAIYSNFASKAELWWALVDEQTRTIDLADLLGTEQSLRDDLASIGRAVWQLLRATSRTDLLLAQEFDLFLMRRPRERSKYARGVRRARASSPPYSPIGRPSGASRCRSTPTGSLEPSSASLTGCSTRSCSTPASSTKSSASVPSPRWRRGSGSARHAELRTQQAHDVATEHVADILLGETASQQGGGDER